jgi:hypothetical protein
MAARVLAQAPARFALAGLSMGGYVAFEILRQAPERVSRLALLDTTAAPDSPERALQRRRSLAILKRGRFLGVTQQLLPTLVHPRHVHGPVGQAVQAMAQRVGPEAYRRQQTAILHRPDSRPLLPTLTQPTLVLGGADDALTPRRWCRPWPRRSRGPAAHPARLRPPAHAGAARGHQRPDAPLAAGLIAAPAQAGGIPSSRHDVRVTPFQVTPPAVQAQTRSCSLVAVPWTSSAWTVSILDGEHTRPAWPTST